MRSLLISLTVFSFFLFSCGDDITTIQNVENKPTYIHIFGNSMMAWNNHGIGKELDELYNWTSKDQKVEFYDYAFVGAMTGQIRNQWERAKENGEQPDIAIVEGGANNAFINAWWCWLPFGQEINEECKNVLKNAAMDMSDLILDLKAHNVNKVVLVIPYHVRGVAAPFNPALDYGIPLFKEICPEAFCSIAELSHWISPDDESLYFIDGVHPSQKGSRRIARVLFNTLNEVD
jgi:lysophospholipase L1-like esterase